MYGYHKKQQLSVDISKRCSLTTRLLVNFIENELSNINQQLFD